MLRRTRFRFQANLVDILNTAASKQKDPADREQVKGPTSKMVMGQNDPIAQQQELRQVLQGTKFKEVVDIYKNATEEDLKKWMTVKHAARVLNLPLDKLVKLKPQEVSEAVHDMMKKSKSRHERQEAQIAADLLFDYLDSQLHVATTTHHYRKLLHNAAMEVDEEIKKDKEDLKEKTILGSGVGFFLLFCTLGFGGFLLFKFVLRDDATKIVHSMRGTVSSMVFMPTNDEPSPDYTTRYANTPSEKEMYTSTMGATTSRVEKAAERYVEEVEHHDDAFLTEIYNMSNREKRAKGKGLKDTTTDDLMHAALHQFPSPLQRRLQKASELEAARGSNSGTPDSLTDDEKIL